MPSARLDTVRRRRRRRAISAVRSAGLYVGPGRAINCRSADAIGAPWAVRPIGSIGPIRPGRTINCRSADAIGAPWSVRSVRPIRSVGTIGPVGAPRPVRPPWSVGSVVAIPPVVFAPGAVAIIVRVDACAERRGANDERQRASEPGHVCDFLMSVKPTVVCTASIAPALRRPYPIMSVQSSYSQDGKIAHQRQAPCPRVATASAIRVKLTRARPTMCRALR